MRLQTVGGSATMFVLMTLGACLSEQGRIGDATTNTTATDATTGDSSADTGSDATCGDCDDGNECTFDHCVDGECRHDGYPASGEAIALPTCEDNDDCASNDPCSRGVCVIEDGCGAQPIGYCTWEAVPGCASCANGCDDGDVCTEDSCSEEGECVHIASPDCDPSCTADGLVPVSQLVYEASIGDVKAVGELAPYMPMYACNDGPTCDCVGEPALGADGVQLRLTDATYFGGGTDIALPPWQCQSHGCGAVTNECTPLVHGATFRVWGAATSNGFMPFGADAIPVPRLTPDTIAVRGYCLDTAPDSLTGDYLASLVFGDMRVTFAVSMLAVDQGVVVEMKGPECASGNCPTWATEGFPQSTVIEEGDGRLGFVFQVSTPNGLADAHATLFSRRGTFAGEVDNFGDEGVVPVGVRLVLERLGDGVPTVQPF